MSVYNKYGPRKKRWKTGSNPHLKLITVYILEDDLDSIESMVEMGLQLNRSEVIRNYIRSGIERDLKIIALKKQVKGLTFEDLGTIKKKRALYKKLQEYFGDDH